MPSLPDPATPRHRPFDPWNSSSTGHQRAETRPGTGWRELRRRKLDVQFGGKPSAAAKESRLQDGHGYGHGIETSSTSLLPRRSVVDLLRQPGLMKRQNNNPRGHDSLNKQHDLDTTPPHSSNNEKGHAQNTYRTATRPSRETLDHHTPQDSSSSSSITTTSPPPPSKRGIFTGTSIYINGSTFPHISDHNLKHIITQHGGAMALHLGRRTVTHVVLGTTTGGALAGGKMEREVRRMRGCGVYFVGVEWVLESLKSGKRLPEARFSNARLARSGQASVYERFSKP
ncbi:hypothetical protein E4U55_001461 [Claviceps digitariae]|nr:hypothetical protein E4U55_001461 [Claviceps digitariae]